MTRASPTGSGGCGSASRPHGTQDRARRRSQAGRDIADNGTVVGTVAGSGSRDKPFMLTADGRLMILDLDSYDVRTVRAANGSGLVVGTFPGTPIGGSWFGRRSARIPTLLDCQSLHTLYSTSAANAINGRGEVA